MNRVYIFTHKVENLFIHFPYPLVHKLRVTERWNILYGKLFSNVIQFGLNEDKKCFMLLTLIANVDNTYPFDTCSLLYVKTQNTGSSGKSKRIDQFTISGNAARANDCETPPHSTN